MRTVSRSFPAWLVLLVLGTAIVGCRHSTSKPDCDGPPDVYVGDYDANEALDEARGGRTLRGTRVFCRTEHDFPAEPRDLFWRMDRVAAADGTLKPLDFDEDRDGEISDRERDAIRGRNTWLVWGGGDEAFWGWLQEQGYGLEDSLILLDSRQRDHRFATAGLINQPGFETSTVPFLGLYLDKAKADGSAILRPPNDQGGRCEHAASGEYGGDGYGEAEPEECDARGRPVKPPVRRAEPEHKYGSIPFTPWTTPKEFEELAKRDESIADFGDYVPDTVRQKLPRDGLDPGIYGYPSGLFGLRLWLNPDFFADSPDAKRAREYWKERVEKTNGRYYTEWEIHSDPKLVRPFRVSMSCGFCHIGPHPLDPPANPEEPEWENLSGVIGGQYWDPQPTFGNLLDRPQFLHHFLRSQAPGTVDTSLISTDHINNTNVINAIFDVPARLERASKKPTERLSEVSQTLKSLEGDGGKPDRHFPMVLFPGEDSVGVFGALARVPINIGVFSEQWARSDNPVVGFTPQRPFPITSARKNSVYWNVNEKYRVGYMADFFLLGHGHRVPKSTEPMKLMNAGLRGRDELGHDTPEKRVRGREVFVQNCAICHSSKQPDAFTLRFTRDEPVGGWTAATIDERDKDAQGNLIYRLPAEYQNWEPFKRSPAYAHYLSRLRALPGLKGAPPNGSVDAEDEFFEDNFLSNELRIPVTLVGTYSGRAMATNAMRGQVWDNFSSESFKELESVGPIRYFNPYVADKGVRKDEWGTNDSYSDGRERGGPGYYRPASLISLWATAPYFHNNALGMYTHDPSVDGRLRAFDDGIRKLLWKDRRPQYATDPDGERHPHPGDLRIEKSSVAENDPGYIYRLPVDTQLTFAPGFTRPLLEGILFGNLGRTLGAFVFWFLSIGFWPILAVVFVVVAARGRARHVGQLFLLIAILGGIVLTLAGAGGYGGTMLGALMMLGATSVLYVPPSWLWALVVALGVVGFWLLLRRSENRRWPRVVFSALAIGTVVLGILVHGFLNGRIGKIDVGPIPRGTPVNLLMSIDPDKGDKLPGAIVALVQALGTIRQRGLVGEQAYAVFADLAGPPLLAASKCPDFVLDRGHWFGEALADEDKEALIAFLKTL